MSRILNAALGLTACLALDAAPAAAQLAEVTLSFDFAILGRHSPWYVAQAKGYYREEGISTKFIDSRGTGQVITALEGGIAQFGLPDVPGLVLGRSKGAKVKVVAIVYQKAPYAVFSLDPGANVTRAEDLVGLELGSGPETFIPQVLQGFMKARNLDPKSVRFTNIAPAARVSMLIARKVPAIHLFTLSQPGIEKALGTSAALRMFVPADHGLDLYSLGLGVTEDYLQKNPAIVRGFVRASMRGWQQAMRAPEEAAEIQHKAIPALDKGVITAELRLIRDLVIVPDTQANGFGWFDPAKMAKTRDFMLANVGVGDGTAPATGDLYVAGYLPDPPIKP